MPAASAQGYPRRAARSEKPRWISLRSTQRGAPNNSCRQRRRALLGHYRTGGGVRLHRMDHEWRRRPIVPRLVSTKRGPRSALILRSHRVDGPAGEQRYRRTANIQSCDSKMRLAQSGPRSIIGRRHGRSGVMAWGGLSAGGSSARAEVPSWAAGTRGGSRLIGRVPVGHRVLLFLGQTTPSANGTTSAGLSYPCDTDQDRQPATGRTG